MADREDPSTLHSAVALCLEEQQQFTRRPQTRQRSSSLSAPQGCVLSDYLGHEQFVYGPRGYPLFLSSSSHLTHTSAVRQKILWLSAAVTSKVKLYQALSHQFSRSCAYAKYSPGLE